MFGFKKKPKFTSEDGTAIFISPVGGIDLRIFKILDRRDGLALISFSDTEKYKIKEGYIRKSRVIIFKTKEGKIIAQNPDNWKNIDLKGKNIKELRFNLQNFSLQESKAAIHRWTLPQDLINKLSPLFKILLICIAVGVLGWSAFKFAAVVLGRVLESRIMDCAQLLPSIPNPIGIVNATPIG
jgi:hypothetical protein